MCDQQPSLHVLQHRKLVPLLRWTLHCGIHTLTGGMCKNNRAPRCKKRGLHDELVQEMGIWCRNIPKIRAMCVCRWLYVSRASYARVQATVGVGTVLIWYFGVAYTRWGGGYSRCTAHNVPRDCSQPTPDGPTQTIALLCYGVPFFAVPCYAPPALPCFTVRGLPGVLCRATCHVAPACMTKGVRQQKHATGRVVPLPFRGTGP